MQDYKSLKTKTAMISIISNTSLVMMKLVVGYLSGAVSIISEAAHSAIDLLAAIIAYYAVKKASLPPDNKHTYGHGKIENISAAVEAALIVIIAIWIVFESVQKIRSPHVPENLSLGMIVMTISVVVNYFVSRRLFKVAHITGSQALEADALHLRTDVWTSGGVLLGLILINITNYYWLDPFIAIGVALFIFKAGYDMTKDNLYELTDVALPPEEEQIIKDILESYDEVVNYHRLRTRKSGAQRYVDMHLVLQKDLPLKIAHDISKKIEIDIKAKLLNCDVTTHLEPCKYCNNK